MNYAIINDNKIPVVGYGTWRVSESEAETYVLKALQAGYRHIDTATIYENERGVGRAIRNSGIARNEIFLVTKVWLNATTYEAVLEEFEKSCQRLETDYIDLYLIHWPNKKTSEQWKALETLFEQKKVNAIGVCNFHEHHLIELMKYAKYKPMINQIEIHPKLSQKNLINYNKSQGILTEAWSPLMKARILENDIIKKLSKRYNKTEAQIVLRWHLQNGVIVIPKSSHIKRMKENIDVFDFVLSKEDMLLIDSINANERVGGNPDVYAHERFGY